MSKVQSLLIYMVVGLLASCTISSSASALQERYIIEGNVLGAPETISDTVSTAILSAEWNINTTLQIKCTKNKQPKLGGREKILAMGMSEEELELTTCELAEIKGGVETKLGASAKCCPSFWK